jgi:uncharacterized membrane protein YGL010W
MATRQRAGDMFITCDAGLGSFPGDTRMKTALEQLTICAAYHRDRRNIATHLVGVPMIVQSIAILLARPAVDISGISITPAIIALAAAGLYYVMLDLRLGLMLTAIIGVMAWAGGLVAAQLTATWLGAGVGFFVVGWIIRFVGHYDDGKKPAFVDDIMGLLIGPLFVLAEVVFACGLRLELKHAVESHAGPTVIRTASGSAA